MITAIYSRDQGRADEFASKHSALADYTSIEELLVDSRVDVAYVASLNNLHAAYVKLAAKANNMFWLKNPWRPRQ